MCFVGEPSVQIQFGLVFVGFVHAKDLGTLTVKNKTFIDEEINELSEKVSRFF